MESELIAIGLVLLVVAAVLMAALGTTPGAIYKSLHDARRKLRADLAA